MRRLLVHSILPLVLFAVAFTAHPALSQTSSLRDVLSGAAHPLTLKLKDLDNSWRRITVGGGGAKAESMGIVGALLGGGTGDSVFYTLGETVTIGSETYLIAYQPPTSQFDFAALMRDGPSFEPPVPEQLTPETALTLSLLNLRSVNSFTNIRPFDLDQEIAPGGKEADPDADPSLRNLKQLALALLLYLQDYDEVFPPMDDPSSVKSALLPYVGDDTVFDDPKSGEAYQPNRYLSRLHLVFIETPEEIVLFYAASANEEGVRGVAYLDGHVEQVSEQAWETLLPASEAVAIGAAKAERTSTGLPTSSTARG